VGNIVGLDATGVLPIPNAESGIEINDGATNNVVGGAAAVDANVVGYNSANGILITDATTTGNTLLGNFIGSRSDLGPAPNTMHGIAVTNGSSGNFVGGTAPGDGNRIHFNTGAGVFIESGTANMVRGNGISLNGGLGIDLAPLGVNPNDPGDGDGGPNNGANYPVINSVLGANGQTTITGMIDVPPGDVHPFIHFYAGGDCDPSGNGEGAVYLGTTSVHALTGTVPFNVTLPVVAPGKSITASLDYLNSSSEFSPCIFTPLPVVSQLVPDNGPAAGGTPVAITGQTFQTGASVQFANEFATNVVVGGPTSITAETPVLSPGVLNTVGVINPDGQAGTFFNAFLSDFIDVPQSHPFHDFVEAIFRAGVTAGCGFGYFCVDQAVPRDQMAVFLLIAKNGSSYVPPPATGTVFLDVPASAFGAAFIEALSAAGVTAGCGGNNYCPADPVTRAQMSVMILRTLEGSMYFPPPATGTVFTDVPLGSFADAWIEEMSDRGITSGCGPGIFCPDLSTTRGQMAVFLTETFGL
jgi:hypothetical protein